MSAIKRRHSLPVLSAAAVLVLLGSGCSVNEQANDQVNHEQKEQKSVKVTVVGDPKADDAAAKKFCDSLDIPASAYQLCLKLQDGSEDEDLQEWADRHGYEIQEHDAPAQAD